MDKYSAKIGSDNSHYTSTSSNQAYARKIEDVFKFNPGEKDRVAGRKPQSRNRRCIEKKHRVEKSYRHQKKTIERDNRLERRAMLLREKFKRQDVRERAELAKLGEMEQPHEVGTSRPFATLKNDEKYDDAVEL